MSELPLIQPKEITVNQKTFIVSKIPTLDAIDLSSRAAKLYKTGLENVSDVLPLCIRVFNLCEIVLTDGRKLRLSNPALINNHVMLDDIAGLLKAMWEHNFNFLPLGQVSNSWEQLTQNLQGLTAQT